MGGDFHINMLQELINHKIGVPYLGMYIFILIDFVYEYILTYIVISRKT